MVSTIKVPVESFLRELHYTGDNRSIAFYRLLIDWLIHSSIHCQQAFRKRWKFAIIRPNPYFKLKKSLAHSLNAQLRRRTSHQPNRIKFRGGSRIFLGGGALVSCSTSTPVNHIVFCLQNTSCIRKPQDISGEGGGVRTPCTLPLDPPLKFQKER